MRTGEPIRDFTEIYHESGVWTQTKWKGVQVCKYVSDLWTYQEILWETRPEVIIETGSGCGGSALFFADMMANYTGCPTVISIDIGSGYEENIKGRFGCRFIQGDSKDPVIVELVKGLTDGLRTMVVLDSDHNAPHVLAEMEAYAPMVSKGCYLVVEDTIAALIMPQLGNNPADAVGEFLLRHEEFHVDKERERFLLTSNPGGYLKRVA